MRFKLSKFVEFARTMYMDGKEEVDNIMHNLWNKLRKHLTNIMHNSWKNLRKHLANIMHNLHDVILIASCNVTTQRRRDWPKHEGPKCKMKLIFSSFEFLFVWFNSFELKLAHSCSSQLIQAQFNSLSSLLAL